MYRCQHSHWNFFRPVTSRTLFFLNFFFSIVNVSISFGQPIPPQNFEVSGYERHIELSWDQNPESNLLGYRIYRSDSGTDDYTQIMFLGKRETAYQDFIGSIDQEFDYKITAVNGINQESDFSDTIAGTTRTMTDEDFLDMVQEYTFRYFWDFGHPVSGLARERNTSGETVTMGGSGFGVMAILVGIERGYISWEAGLDRLLKIVLFLENADRFHGVFPHWMNGTTGEVRPFSSLDNGGDIVETAFLFEGLLTVREYFSGNTANEVVLRQKITNMWEEIQWDWYRNNQDVIYWHWSPNHDFAISLPVRGWNETMMVYILGLASPTNSVPASLYETGWAGGNYVNGFSIYGHQLFVGSVTGGPLFFAHYSFIGFDPRFIKDQYANYFIHNRNHTLVNRAYCIDNPQNHTGYSDICWGLTASDDPLVGYLAHEATPNRDNGTITPTAALSSMPYTPQESIEALKHFYRDHGERLWGPMGFYDAFNLNQDWFAESYLAIDQGPIICMIENYRSQLLWNNFMKNPEINVALDKMDFEPDSSLVVGTKELLSAAEFQVYPNPVRDVLWIECSVSDSENTSMQLLKDNAEIVRSWQSSPSGNNKLRYNVQGLIPGVYFLVITSGDLREVKKIFIQ
jgi:hypothetical protein